jgi:3-oxoacyl-[acyl-carrier-protein] synthase-3
MGVIEMNGQSVFREAVAQLTASTKALLKQENVPLEAIDWIIPHQANKRILDHMQKDLGVPAEKMLYTGDFHANTSAASIPLTWWKARQDGTILPGQLLLLQAFGAGFTWGACLVRS